VKTLDGLGAVGGGAHGVSEHVIVETIPFRTALVAGIAARIVAG
jgi:glutamate carboxypeptidase